MITSNRFFSPSNAGLKDKPAAAICCVLGLMLLVIPASAQSRRDDESALRLVVALFRHGVRTPLSGSVEEASKHARRPWPDRNDWQTDYWEEVTPHGEKLAAWIGTSYGDHYKELFTDGSCSIFLWADKTVRTRQTAESLAAGLSESATGCKGKLSIHWLESAESPDPLFHPFEAQCGRLGDITVAQIMERIKNGAKHLHEDPPLKYKKGLESLSQILACDCSLTSACVPFQYISEEIRPGVPGHDPGPVRWTGALSFASGASETFLLQGATGMTAEKVGWGQVDPPNRTRIPLGDLMQLHELYFDYTERDEEAAKIKGSNLAREVLQTLASAVPPIPRPVMSDREICQHAPPGSKLVGLIGHDTNLANLSTLLGLKWSFPDSWGLPGNDALPGGALVFELRYRKYTETASADNYFVRIYYVAQTLDEMRNAKSEPLHWLNVSGVSPSPVAESPYDVPYVKFYNMVNSTIGGEYLSRCWKGRQLCGTELIGTK